MYDCGSIRGTAECCTVCHDAKTDLHFTLANGEKLTVCHSIFLDLQGSQMDFLAEQRARASRRISRAFTNAEEARAFMDTLTEEPDIAYISADGEYTPLRHGDALPEDFRSIHVTGTPRA